MSWHQTIYKRKKIIRTILILDRYQKYSNFVYLFPICHIYSAWR